MYISIIRSLLSKCQLLSNTSSSHFTPENPVVFRLEIIFFLNTFIFSLLVAFSYPSCYNTSLPLTKPKRSHFWLLFCRQFLTFAAFMRPMRFWKNVPAFYMKIFIPVLMLFNSPLRYNFVGIFISKESRINFRSGSSTSMKRYRSPESRSTFHFRSAS